MIDLSWLAEIGKVLGGGVVGWAGRTFTERSKTRRMRRDLYRELAFNYWVLCKSEAYLRLSGYNPTYTASEGAGRIVAHHVRDLHTRDYDRALSYLETFNNVPEYHLFDIVYRDIKTLIAMLPEGAAPLTKVYAEAQWLKESFEERIRDGQFDVAIMKSHPDNRVATSVEIGPIEAEKEWDVQRGPTQIGRQKEAETPRLPQD